MGASATTNSQQANASNTAANSNTATNFGTNTAASSGSNTVANTATAQGPSQAGQALINSATNPSNTIGNISAFLSPYTQNVLNSQVAVENQQNAIQQQGLQGAAASAGALGGDRLGVAQGVLGGQQTLANNATNAGILQQGYNQALGAAQTTAGQQLQGAGLAGTVGSSSANTGQLSQNLSQTLGQTQAATSNAQATAGTGSGSSTTTQNPGALGYGALGLALLSDERVKENVKPIGKTFDGQPIYKFNYTGRPETQIGFLAQEVEKHHPEAVHSIGDLKLVDYDTATKDAERKRADGGAIQHRDLGGPVTGQGSNMVAVNYNGQIIYVPASSVPGSGGSNTLASMPGMGGNSGYSPSSMYKLGQQASGFLSNVLGNGSSSGSSAPASGSGSLASLGTMGAGAGSNTPTPSSGGFSSSPLGTAFSNLGSLANNTGNAISRGFDSLGSSLGFASGGSTNSAPSSFYTPAAAAPAVASPLAGLSSTAFYTPAVAAQATPTMPSLAAPMASMPNIAMPTVQAAVMPTVSYPGFDPVSSGGKGSGGAVSLKEHPGIAKLLEELKGAHRDDGGGVNAPDGLGGFLNVGDMSGLGTNLDAAALPVVQPASLGSLFSPAQAAPAETPVAAPITAPTDFGGVQAVGVTQPASAVPPETLTATAPVATPVAAPAAPSAGSDQPDSLRPAPAEAGAQAASDVPQTLGTLPVPGAQLPRLREGQPSSDPLADELRQAGVACRTMPLAGCLQNVLG